MVHLKREVILGLLIWWLNVVHAIYRSYLSMGLLFTQRRRCINNKSYTVSFYARREQLMKMLYSDDTTCYDQFRMNRKTFDRLCSMLHNIGGLKSTKNMLVNEQVAMFLHILAHHVKSRVIRHRFGRSGETISRHFNMVLIAMLRLQGVLFKTPEPIPENSFDDRWKWFKNCLGALDGTHIRIKVPIADKPRYRNRKGEITTNVLGVCSPDLQFIYVLLGWEGSAADGRVLRDAISRRNGLKVPQGRYYLVDAGFTNCEGFLAPYRGQKYHLNEWREGHMPTSPQEFFNMKHSAARNTIERAFGILKLRWTILRSPSWYLVRTYNQIIIACCLLHNFIRQYNDDDPLEDEVGDMAPCDSIEEHSPIITMESTDAWSAWRDRLANEMFTDFRHRRASS